MGISNILSSLGEWDSAQSELTDPAADGPRPVINRALCDANATSLGASVINVVNPAAGLGLPAFCKPYYDDLGVDPPSVVPPFEGGQCPGALYDVTIEITRQGLSNTTLGRRFEGPLGTPYFVAPQLLISTGDGIKVVASGTGFGAVTGFVGMVVNFRVDGQPDDCGDPPGEFVPSPGYPTPRPINSPTTVNIGGNNVDVTISDVRTSRAGDTYVTVGGPGFEVDIPIEGPGEIVRPPEVTTGEPTDVTSGGGREEDDLTEEEEAEGLETIGYKFDLLGLPTNLSGIPDTDPQVLVTPYGNVQLEYETPGGLVLFSDNLPIRVVSGSIIRQDTNLKVTAVRYQKRPDVSTIRLTPVRVKVV